MRIIPRVDYEKIVVIRYREDDVFAEKGKDLSLLGVSVYNGYLRNINVGENVELNLDFDMHTVSLKGKVMRKNNDTIFIRFLEDSNVIASTVGVYIKKVVFFKEKCPYCGSRIQLNNERCPQCNMLLSFDNPEFVDVITKIRLADIVESFMKFKDNECPSVKEEIFEMIGTSKKMKEVFKLIRKFATTDFPVLIVGESGTGKELTAKAIHERSLRKDKPYVIVDCTSIPENLLESELFGYEKGAFTGADKRKIGRIELAEGGTLFLDEIGDLPLGLQAKLLRFLENYTFTRVGGTQPIKANVRVIAATNVNLEKAVKEGKFREDLFYRLNVLTIQLPPLREREDDVEVIARYFVNKYSKEIKKNIKGLTPRAVEALKNYSWPGNVRELVNVIRKAVVMTEGEYIDIYDLDEKIINFKTNSKENQETADLPELEVAKIKALEKAYKEANGNISKISKILGISRPTVYKLLNKYNIGRNN